MDPEVFVCKKDESQPWSFSFIYFQNQYIRSIIYHVLIMRLFFLLLVWFPLYLFAQNVPFDKDHIADKERLKAALKEIKKGDSYYEMGGFNGYSKALYHYKNASTVNASNIDLNVKMGDCYLHSYDRAKALDHLRIARNLDTESNPLVTFLMGQAYQLNLEPDSALVEYSRYLSQVKDTASEYTNSVVKRKIEECNYARELMKSPKNVRIENMGSKVNSRFAEYCPVISADESVMIFTSRRNNTTGGEIDPETDDYYEDIYYSVQEDGEWKAPKNMGDMVNTIYHDATVGLSPDGQELLIYNDDEGDGNIYRCELKGSEWSMPVKLGNNVNSEYHEPSACFTFDGRTLYFVTNKPGGLGGKDIYSSRLNEFGEWGPAVNLGAPINTPGDEDAVFMHPDGVTLYFSSNGHPSMGGYDIYKSTQEGRSWTQPENLGFPINSPDNDVFFVISASGEHGYYSSVKADSYGNLDLYRVTFLKDSVIKAPEPNLTLLKGIVIDDETEEPLEAVIEIIDNDANQVVGIFRSNSKTGKFLVSLPSGKNYGISVNAEDYLFHSENFDIKDTIGYQEVQKDIRLKKFEIGKSIVLKNIFFEFDKATIKPESVPELEKLQSLLLEYRSLMIEISGHTDSKGDDDYNLKLSQERASAVVTWLIDKGIDQSRMIAKGSGETKPIAPNEHPDGRDNPEGRAMNRRTEFKILGY